MISSLLFFLPLATLVTHTEKLTLTSGLTIEAQYLPENDAFLISLESFGALTADLELAGPSCTKRITSIEAECKSALDDALVRAEERQVDLYNQWVKDQSTITDYKDRLRDTDSERVMWRWIAVGAGLVAIISSSVLVITN